MGKTRNRCREMPIQEAEWHECEFQDSGLYDGRFYPRLQVTPLLLAADQVYPIETVSDVVQSLYITVISGVLSLWFRDHSADPRPDGDQAHMEFVSDVGTREIVLPPGEKRLVVGAANDATCRATIVIMDREAHHDRRGT